MGGGSSKPAPLQGILKGVDYSNRAALSKSLSDTILTLLFREADFKDLLTLSSIGQCPRYVFTTAQALQQLFQTIQVYPQYGKQGEIMFAPIQKLAPGILKDKTTVESNADQLRRQQRDKMCMDVAYLYVRIFQIYGALALTTLDANPVRGGYLVPAPPTSRLFVAKSQAGPSAAPLFGQRGGGMLTTGIGAQVTRSMNSTPFEAVTPFFSLAKTKTQTATKYLEMDDKTEMKNIGTFLLKWEPTIGRNGTTVPGFYKSKKKNEKPVQSTVEMTWEDKDKTVANFIIDNTTIVQLQRGDFDWEFLYDSGESSDPTEFIRKVHEYFTGDAITRSAGVSTTARRPGVSTGTYGVSLSTGKSSFESFDQLKKLYEERQAGKGFPKAYCVARALTLLKPIFDSEVFDPKYPFFTSQVCRRKLDFEAQSGEQMPRARKQPKANVYFRSLTSLYYDTYEVLGNGEVVFSQTPEGKDDLKKVSTLFAQLFNISSRPEEFLESSTEFTDSKVLCGGKDVGILIKDPKLRIELMEKCIKPMLDFQQKHTVEVNKLLQAMFIVRKDKFGESIAFSKELQMGRQGVNKFGKLARDLLARYYQMSEILYTQGVRLMERNPAGIQQIA
jgi:hypothetical protein